MKTHETFANNGDCGDLAEMTGSLFPSAFLCAALSVLCSAYSYVKLSNAYSSAGGIAMYLEKAYGSYSP